MKNVTKFLFLLIISALFLINLQGCATTKRAPIYLDPSFTPNQIDAIVVLPVIDRRIDKSVEIDFHNQIHLTAAAWIERKGYIAVIPDTACGQHFPVSSEVLAMDSKAICALASDSLNFVLILYVEDILKKHSLFKYQTKMEVTGLLLDRHKQAVLWKDKGIGVHSGGGILGAIEAAVLYTNEGIDLAMSNLFQTLPDAQWRKQPGAAAQ